MVADRKPYPSDVGDAEWALVAPSLTLLGTVKLSLLGTDGGPKVGNDRRIEDRIWLLQALATARTGSVWGGFVQ